MSNGVKLEPVSINFTLKDHIYDVLRDAILDMNIYDEATDLRLDKRKLAEQLGISRTPIREALARLEQSGFVEILPRRGVYVRRKSLNEVLEIIVVWAGLESMAARLAAQRATDAELELAAEPGGEVQPAGGKGSHRRVFRAEHSVPPAHIRAVGLHDAEDHCRRTVPAHARGAAPRDGRERPRHALVIGVPWGIIEALESRDPVPGGRTRVRAHHAAARACAAHLDPLESQVESDRRAGLGAAARRSARQGRIEWRYPALPTSWAHRDRSRAVAVADRRVPPRHRRPEAERDRHDLRRARHPDHGSRPSRTGRRHAGHLVPPRAECGQRSRDRRLLHPETRRMPHRLRARLPQRADRARQRHNELLSDDPDLGLVGARDRRPAAGRLRGDGSARHRQAAVQGGLPRAARRRTSASPWRAPSARRCRAPGRRLS